MLEILGNEFQRPLDDGAMTGQDPGRSESCQALERRQVRAKIAARPAGIITVVPSVSMSPA